jgi:hypothetical protein
MREQAKKDHNLEEMWSGDITSFTFHQSHMMLFPQQEVGWILHFFICCI